MFFGTSQLFVNQVAVSAVLVFTVSTAGARVLLRARARRADRRRRSRWRSPRSCCPPTRCGCCATPPGRCSTSWRGRSTTSPRALRTRDPDAAEAALVRARGIDELGERFFDATLEGRETTPHLARAPARARARSSSTPRPRPGSTSPSATCACSPAARCGRWRWTRTCRRRSPTRSSDLGAGGARARRRAGDAARASTPCASRRCAPPRPRPTCSRARPTCRCQRDRRPGPLDRHRPADRDRAAATRRRRRPSASASVAPDTRGTRSRPAADRRPLERRPAARARRRRACGRAMKSPVWTPPLRIASRVAARRTRRRWSSSSVAELARGAPRMQAGAPERLVGQQVADAGDRALVEQPRLQRHRAAADALAEDVARDLGGVRADVREVGLDHRAAEPALVAQREPAAVGELEHEAVPVVRARRLVDDDPSRHPEVQAEIRARRRSRPRGTCRGGGPRSAVRPISAAAISPGACGRLT